MLGHLAQGQFAQSDQIAAAKEILQRLADFVGGVNVAALHALLKRLGREIHHDGFVGRERNPVGHRFANDDAGDCADGRGHAFHVLDIHGGEDVDLRGENFLHVLVALSMLAAGNVGVRQFIHQHDLRLAGEDGIHVHFLEQRAFVFDLLSRKSFELRDQVGEAFSAVSLDHADDDIFIAGVAANAFAQHAVSLADAGSIAEEKLEDASRLLGLRCGFEPIFGSFGHSYLPGLEFSQARLE